MKKLKFKSDIFKSSSKSIFLYIFFIHFFIHFYFMSKVSEILSAKNYQENKERQQKKARERY